MSESSPRKTHAFAILAPVPEYHLVSGLETCRTEGEVAFGSMAFELFRKIDEIREEKVVDMFLYASHSQGDRPLYPEVTWQAVYVRHVTSRNGRYPGGKRFRPASTVTDKPNWAIFWVVRELEPLSAPIPIQTLRGFEKKEDFSERFFPEGPLVIDHPAV